MDRKGLGTLLLGIILLAVGGLIITAPMTLNLDYGYTVTEIESGDDTDGNMYTYAELTSNEQQTFDRALEQDHITLSHDDAAQTKHAIFNTAPESETLVLKDNTMYEVTFTPTTSIQSLLSLVGIVILIAGAGITLIGVSVCNEDDQ